MTDFRQRAAQIQAAYGQQRDAVRANRNLSEEGKRNELARLKVDTDRKLAELREQRTAEQKQRERDLGTMLFRVSPEQQAEMAQYVVLADQHKTPAGFARAMDRAQRHGNGLLLQALAEAAYDRGHTKLTQIYFADRGLGDQFQEWHGFQVPPSRAEQATQRIDGDIMFTADKPGELAGWSDVAIGQMATGADPAVIDPAAPTTSQQADAAIRGAVA